MEQFDIIEEAKAFGEKRRKEIYAECERKGDKVLDDNSFIGQSVLDGTKHVAFMCIWTQSMLDDIQNQRSWTDICEEEEKMLKRLEK
jgi:alcohol dehydrogenase YqhD (iron-dependent ADH family)